jgi:hypothetical protein
MKKTRTVPRVIVTDKFRSCGAAHREVMAFVEPRQSTYVNNRAENIHQPTKQRLPLGGRGTVVSVRVQRHLASLPAPPPSDPRIRLSSRDDRPLRDLEQTTAVAGLPTAP